MRSTITFGVLGPLRVVRDGEVVPVPAPKQRTILAMLLLRGNERLSLEEMVDWVWERPPERARSAVQQYVHRLRRIIGEETIQTVAGGYLLRVEPDQIDLNRFREQVRSAQTLADAGVLSKAAATLRSALDLWTDGSPLVDVPSHHLQLKVVPSLVQERLSALQRAIDLDLGMGRHREVVAELTRLTGQFPLHEVFWRQLMLALHRSGRPAEALNVYGTARRLFADELGVDPGPELQQLYQSLLTGQPTNSGPVPVGDWAQQHDQVWMPVRPTFQLPHDTADFVGRADLLAEMRRVSSPRWRGARVIVLTGKAGMGKTALAIRHAHQLRSQYPEGQFHLQLQDETGRPVPTAVSLSRILVGMGVAEKAVPRAVNDRAALYRSMLSGRRVLMILDDAATVEQVTSLLPGDPGCLVLVTSRVRLTGIPGVLNHDLEPLTPDESRELLNRIVGPDRMAESLAAAAELVRLSDGLPLAVRIMGARLVAKPHWSLGHLVDRLARSSTRLGELEHGDLSVRRRIKRSYRQLAPDVRAAFCRLETLGPFPFTAHQALACLNVTHAEAEDLVEQLVDARLVDPVTNRDDPPAYRLDGFARLLARRLTSFEMIDPKVDLAECLSC
jgi:DNA-binding SARP family transcriptional activator